MEMRLEEFATTTPEIIAEQLQAYPSLVMALVRSRGIRAVLRAMMPAEGLPKSSSCFVRRRRT